MVLGVRLERRVKWKFAASLCSSNIMSMVEEMLRAESLV